MPTNLLFSLKSLPRATNVLWGSYKNIYQNEHEHYTKTHTQTYHTRIYILKRIEKDPNSQSSERY